MKLAEQQIEVHAPRELCFEVVAAAGTRVERRSDVEWVVEFVSDEGSSAVRTVELLTLERPHAIHYEWLEGPLDEVRETIFFDELDPATTRLRYVGEFSFGGGPIRDAVARLRIKPKFDRLVRDHLEEARTVAERRAARSRVYPR